MDEIKKIFYTREDVKNDDPNFIPKAYAYIVYEDGTYDVFNNRKEEGQNAIQECFTALSKQTGIEDTNELLNSEYVSFVHDSEDNLRETMPLLMEKLAENGRRTIEPVPRKMNKWLKGTLVVGTIAIISGLLIGSVATHFSNKDKPAPYDGKDIDFNSEAYVDFDSFMNAITNEEAKAYYQKLNDFLYYMNDDFASQVHLVQDGDKQFALSVNEGAYLMLASTPYVRNASDAVNGAYTPETIYNVFGDYKLDADVMYQSVNDTTIRMFKAYSRITTKTNVSNFIKDEKTKMQYGALEAAIINYNGASTVSLQNEALKQGMTVVREMFHLNETVSRNIIPDDVTLALPAVNYIVGLAKPKAIGLTSMEQEKLDVEVSTCNHAKNKFIDMEADQAIMLQNKSLEETADLYEVNTKGDTETPDVTLVKEDPKFEQYKLLTDPLMMSLSGFNVNLEPEKANLDFASHENKPDTKVNGNGGATTTTKPKTTTVSEKDLPSVLAKLPPEKKKEVEAKIEKQKEDINIKLDIKNDPNYLKGYADAGQAVYNSTYNNVYNKKNKMSDDLLWVNASNAALALKEGKVVNYQKGVTDMVSSEQANLGATYSSFYLGKKDARDRLSKEEAARIFNENPPVHYDPGYEYLNDGNQNSNDGYYPPTGGSTITEGEIHDNGVQDRPDFGNTTTSATSIQNSSRDAYVENIISNMESNPQSYVDSSTDIKTR